MYNLSEIIGKSIISLYEGKVLGTINKVTFEKKLKKITNFIFFEAENDEEEFVIHSNSIFAVGENALVIKNTSAVEPLSNLEPQITLCSPINLQVFTTQGVCLGKVRDVSVDATFNVCSIVISNGETLSAQEVVSFSDNAILIQDENVKINTSKFSKQNRPKLIKTETPVTILRADTISPILSQLQNTIATLPTKVTSSVNFLVGRVVTQNLYSQSRELIAKKGSLISQKTIENAKKNGKIKELSIFSA